MKRLTAIITALVVAVLAMTLFAGCGSNTSDQKVLRVGAETTFPPFEFSDNDKYVGFDLDLTKAIADKLGYKYEFKSMGFDALIPALKTGDINVIASGINPTPERAKQVIFSEPYFTEGGFITLVNKGNTTIKSLDDLQGKTIVVQIGTVPVDIAKNIPGTKVKEVDSNAQLFTELKAGTADAAILDNAVAMYYLNNGAKEELKTVGKPVQPEPYVMAFRQDDTSLQKEVNRALAELKKDGTYDKIYAKWFGSKADK